MIAILIGITLVGLGALIGIIVMAMFQINRIAEPVGIVETIEEEELLP
jgi:hypothetical protein